MINKDKLHEVLELYKKEFNERWTGERFKWKAVKWFQDNWDINAPDFAKMLDKVLDQSITCGLLTSRNNFPRGVIVELAAAAPEEVRSMFIGLFDETRDLVERISSFREQADILREKYAEKFGQHYQNENAITTYLWLRYPDKYYIYKYSEVRKVAEVLGADVTFSKGAYAENIRNFMKLYDELCDALKDEPEIADMVSSALDDECYPDPELKSLTIDVGFYISRYFGKGDSAIAEEEWFPTLSEYDPGFTKEQWLELLRDENIIGPVWGGLLAAFYGMGGEATCTQVAIKYNRPPFSVNSSSVQLAKRIHRKTNCPMYIGSDGKTVYFTLLFQGRGAGKDVDGTYVWRIRPELYDALTEFDIMRYDWLSGGEQKTAQKNEPVAENVNYWWLNANPKIWSFSQSAIGEVQSYTMYNNNGNKRRIFQNFLDAKPGDLVIGYESNPVKQIVATCIVVEGPDDKCLYIQKTGTLANPIDYATIKDCPELADMEYLVSPQGSLFKLTKSEYDFIRDLIIEENPTETGETIEKYSKSDFLNEVYMSDARYEDLVGVLRNKKNLILQGAPGVGKTFAARRLAWSMMGVKDESRIELVQFHQNYSYEDFVMGYKPEGEGFELKYGIFYRFCQKAAASPDKEFFFIIDEINRGNMSKIFGELLMLIEKDYRGTKATLAYNGLPFSVPKNLFIIGMMNTADRSIAMIDYALRRRFGFFDMGPGFDTKGFGDYQKKLKSELFDKVVNEIKQLNEDITKDKSLGKGFCVGHSYFCGQKSCTDNWLRAVVDYDILPMLREYWFDDDKKYISWENRLKGIFQG